MIDNEFQVHATYFATRPAVFPKPTLCEVKPRKNVTNCKKHNSNQTYLFFNDFLPKSLNILLIILPSTMYDCKFDLGQVIFFCILLKPFYHSCSDISFDYLPGKDVSDRTDYHQVAYPGLVCPPETFESAVE